jgi:intracellular sulfur oxidation DsrE/DsrF family protein
MGSFLRKLCTAERKPERIVFYNSGVKLLVKGSPVSDAIEMLLKTGIDLIACGTCVHYFKLQDSIDPKHVGDMQRIISILMDSHNVVTV